MLISYFVITFIVVIYMSVDGIPTIAHFTSRPYSPTFLTLEHQHGSIVTWEGNNLGVLTMRHHYHMKDWLLDDSMMPYIVFTKLYGVTCLGNVKIDHAIVTMLVEQWCRKTHTFHLLIDEATKVLIVCCTPSGYSNPWSGRNQSRKSWLASHL